MDKDELNFEIERARYQGASVWLAVRMLCKAYVDSGRLGRCLGSQEFGLAWLFENFEPRDLIFEQSVLSGFLETVGECDG